jgi:hypothetical protein
VLGDEDGAAANKSLCLSLWFKMGTAGAQKEWKINTVIYFPIAILL